MDIKVKLVDNTELKAVYVEEGYYPDTNDKRLTIRLDNAEGYSIDSLSSLFVPDNFATTIIAGRTISGFNKLESIAWRISEFDKVGNLTVSLGTEKSE